jgi:SAM-dependent methyltransferase
VTFDVAAEAYDRFMGRYSRNLSAQMANLAGIKPGHRALDVGCGPGALVAELVARLGPGSVVGVDPSESFVMAARSRHPGVHIEKASAERLPFADGDFDAALAQLVVHFMADPVTGLAEMARVTRSGGTVTACVWDHAGGEGPLGVFWRAARRLHPDAPDESTLAGARAGHLAELFAQAALLDIEEAVLTSEVQHASFDEWWEPFTAGVGPAGKHVASLDEDGVTDLRELCRELLPKPPFVIAARAWAARGRVPQRRSSGS